MWPQELTLRLCASPLPGAEANALAQQILGAYGCVFQERKHAFTSIRCRALFSLYVSFVANKDLVTSPVVEPSDKLAAFAVRHFDPLHANHQVRIRR